MSFIKLLIPAVIFFGLNDASLAQSARFKPLKDVRSKLHAPAYSVAEKELVVNQALMMLEKMYVHAELKLNTFGPSADFSRRLADLKAKLNTIGDDEFHHAMQSIFRDLHDLHTNYTAPLPLACSYVFSPFVFRDVQVGGKRQIVVEGLSRVYQNVPGDHKSVKPLDQLISVDGLAIDDYLEQVIKPESGGANEDAMIVYGLKNLAVRALSELPVPAKDNITFTFKGADGEYSVTSDYLAIFDEPSCHQSMAGVNGVQGRFRPMMTKGEELPLIRNWKKYVQPSKIVPFEDDILSEIGSIQDLETPAGRITYFMLETFMPENASSQLLIHRVKEELMKRHKDSAGLIIDIRGNGGGDITLAEEMTQIFTPSVINPMPVRMLPNSLNLEAFLSSNNGEENAWSTEQRRAIDAGDQYTNPLRITLPRNANRFGQVWFKPVVVLTDAACYSACDLFAAAMQDHAAATLIGTHSSTGAGGANVMTYDVFRSIFGGAENKDNPFVELPGFQSFRVSWRQTLRTGLNKDKLIENYGVKPDVEIRYTKEDLINGESKALMKKVHAVVDKMKPRYKSLSLLASSLRMKNGESAVWKEEVKGVDTLEILHKDQVVKEIAVKTTGEVITVELPEFTGEWTSKKFDLVGKLNGKTSFRVVRRVFWRGEDVKLTQAGLAEKFTDGLKYTRVTTYSGDEADGWQVVGNTMRVGSGPKYKSNLATEAFIPLDLSKARGPLLLMIDFKMRSENYMDTLNIISRDPDTGRETYLYSLYGDYDLPRAIPIDIPHGPSRAEIVLEFESDENWNLEGPVIRSLGVRTQSEQELTRGKGPSDVGPVLTVR